MRPWIQEQMWVRRNDQGVVVGISDKPPQSDDFIPNVPLEKRDSDMKNDRSENEIAAGQGD